MPRTVVISINSSWNIVNFRRGLIEALRARGWRIVALSPDDSHSARLGELGAEHVPIAIDSSGMSPLRDLVLLARYRRRLASIRPVAFLGFTAKPNIYGSLAARSLGIAVINNISGLGTAFIGRSPLRRLVSALYRFALSRSPVVFFQNPDDRAQFLADRLVRVDQARLLPGSGIDLDRFAPADCTGGADRAFTFLLAGRLLRQKGVEEFVAAARIVRREAPAVRFQLLGFLDAANRSAIGRDQVERWVAEGVVEYLGAADDVRPHLAAADCIVLPSYREGLPRSLLEGAAMAKPLIATDVPGCRQLVAHGENGLLCAARDAEALAAAMLAMLRLDPAIRQEMGTAGRKRVERDFAEQVVIERYVEALETLVTARDA